MAVAAVAQPKAKTPRMKSVKAAPSHPTYLKMIQEAIASIKDRKGASRPAIKAFVGEKYKLDDNSGKFIRNLNTALKKGVTDGTLKQPYGNQGRFSLGEAVAKKKRTNKVKSSRSSSLDKKTKSAGSSPSTPKVKSARKTKSSTSGKKKTAATGTTKKAAAKKSAKSPVANSTGAAKKKAPAKAAKASAKTVKTAKENKDAKPKARGKKKTVDDTQSSTSAASAPAKAPSKKTSTKAKPKPALSKKASSMKNPPAKQ
ncbi:hypothetical protein WR25_01833 [Diploscapter pachys]|uniref:H15 domain-containing protein n=1 Tax=Diploscapter pachys TaxID=2018661 RepID=A0A2A2JCR5_9BILA|nr:hypothetical protein WR25_01833 [Diploscapter pachys]